MSISKLCGGRSAIKRYQIHNEIAEISKIDDIPLDDIDINNFSVVSSSPIPVPAPVPVPVLNPSPSPSPSLSLTLSPSKSISKSSSVVKHLSSPVAANLNSNSVQLQQKQQNQHHQQYQQQQQQQTYLPQTSLLKIRPFVPSLNTRLRRPIGRSYSTLSSTYAKRSLTTSNNIYNTNININTNTNANANANTNNNNTNVKINANTNSIVKSNGHWSQVPIRNEAAIIKHQNQNQNQQQYQHHQQHYSGNVVVGGTIDRSNVAISKITRSMGNVRRQTIKVITHQRSKSTSSSAASTSASNRPTTTASIRVNYQDPTSTSTTSTTTTLATSAIVTAQPNGICRITRLPKEQEKLPDRINYDRRGLTAIPIFENESNLRLLSLQHNLINVFHIPKEKPKNEMNPSNVDLDLSLANVHNDSNGGMHFTASYHRSNSVRMPQSLHSPVINNAVDNVAMSMLITATTATATTTPTPTPTSILPSSQLVSLGVNGPNNQLLKRNNLLKNHKHNINASQMLRQQQQQQQLQQRQTHYRFAMKKSKSFINNYTKQLNGSTNKKDIAKAATAAKTAAITASTSATLNKTQTKMFVLLGRTHLKSFDSSASASGSASASTNANGNANSSALTSDSLSTMIETNEFEENEFYQQHLEIKNKQLHPSYGLIFQNLVFLDLYDNQIERIANLDGLPTLSVLLLGKNRITDISGLVSLRETLRVLDLHGNKITSISNKINCLQGLKSLNLAGNQIRQINQNDFNGLQNLKELNLKRNRIRRINGFQHLIALERLWLCHNDLHKVEDMSSIAKAISLLEVTIENNPVSLAGDCVSFLVSYLPNLQSLSQMPITDQVRRAAMAWRKNKEFSEANHHHAQRSSDVFNSIRREEVISNARTNWELLRSQQTMYATLKSQRCDNKQPELTKINESNETAVDYEDLQEYIKLPPIQKPQQTTILKCQEQAQGQVQGQAQTQTQTQEDTNVDEQSRSTNSSLGPNVDSSSSSYSSDNEETPKKRNEQNDRMKKIQTKSSTSKQQQQQKQQQKQQPNIQSTQENSDNANQSNQEKRNASNNQMIDAIAESCNSNATNAIRTPTPITAITTTTNNHNNSLIYLGYNHDNFNSICYETNHTSSSNFESASKVSSTTAAATIVTLAAEAASQTTTTATTTTKTIKSVATLSTTTTTTTTTTTSSVIPPCRRYMRGSLMRSQVVVGSVGGYSSNVNGSASNNVGGKLKLVSRNNNINMVNGQQITDSIVSLNGLASSAISTTTTTTSIAQSGQASTNFLHSVAVTQPNATCTSSNTTTAITATLTPTPTPTPTTTTTSTSTITSTSTKLSTLEREREQGGDYLIEICGRYLNIYGQGALRFIDKQWNPAKANDVHTLNFSYINFNNIVSILSRIKVRFPHAEHFVFRETNISCLGQLNALAELQGITSLFIDPEGNSITIKDLWRQYAIYRLSHWGLKLLNSIEISATEIDEANEMYAGLSELVLWSMPDIMLHPLLARLRLDETCTASKMSPKEWLMKTENKSLRFVVGKEALQWKKPNNNSNYLGNGHAFTKCIAHQNNNYLLNGHHHNDIAESVGLGGTDGVSTSVNATSVATNSMAISIRDRGKMHFTLMMENTCNAIEKLHKLEHLWPSLLLDIVRNTLLDYSQLDTYLRSLMAEIMK